MGWPEVTVIVLYTLVMGMTLAMHGKPRTGNYNFGASLLGVGLLFALLYAGGFFAA